MANFSILILTFNEEPNISHCLDSVDWADDVVVLDSFSSDRTCEIVESRDIRIYQRKFDDFGSQRNHAIDNIQFKHDWVFHLDADERFNERLREECERVILLDEMSAFFVPNRIIFLGKWIKHCTQYPYPQVRLIKLGEVRFAKSGHGQKEDQVLRGIGNIHVPYDHFNFSKGIEDWIEKHNRYSSEEAHLALTIQRQPIVDCFFGDKIKRKRALKSWFVRLPFRPQFKFLFLFLAKGGFLDGYPGFLYCRLQAMYELMITFKREELKKSE